MAADCSKDEQILSLETSEKDTTVSSFLQRASFTASFYSAGGKYHSREDFQKAIVARKAKAIAAARAIKSDKNGALVENMLVEYYDHLARTQTMVVSQEQVLEWNLPKYLKVGYMRHEMIWC